jgi:hypothetical protein
LLLLASVRLWLMPMPTSFWVDETVTAFVVRHGGEHPSLKAAPQVPASIYYVLPRLMDRWVGLSEIAYRVPSALALGLALWLIARLAAIIIHPEAGWFPAFACIAFRIQLSGADARPYALGTCVLAAALLFRCAGSTRGAGATRRASRCWRRCCGGCIWCTGRFI